MYTNYKIARDTAWKTLIEVGITQLPLKLSLIAKYYGIQIINYGDSGQDYSENEDGYSTKLDSKLIIYYNELKPKQRIRFTIAHELGHCILGHVLDNEYTYRYNNETDKYKDPKEIQANVFARDILMPATILHSLRISSVEEIAKICNVSRQSAEIRYDRLLELEKRNMFNKHPLERQVYNQFKNYIEKECKLRNSLHSE